MDRLWCVYWLTRVPRFWRFYSLLCISFVRNLNDSSVKFVSTTVHVNWYKRRHIIAFDSKWVFMQRKMQRTTTLMCNWNSLFCRYWLAFLLISCYIFVRIRLIDVPYHLRWYDLMSLHNCPNRNRWTIVFNQQLYSSWRLSFNH